MLLWNKPLKEKTIENHDYFNFFQDKNEDIKIQTIFYNHLCFENDFLKYVFPTWI
jgi:hypothetical protein